MKSSGIGGQAVIEGIMMRNGENYAVAVRKPDHTIEVKKTLIKELHQNVEYFAFHLYVASLILLILWCLECQR